MGEQKDIGEFNLNLLERIEEGLGELNRNISELDDKNIEDEGENENTKSTLNENLSRQSSILEDVGPIL